MNKKTQSAEGTMVEYVTAMIGGQLFGLPISRVQDVFMPERVTRVPLSSREIAGVLNLRGRIVTVVDMRARLGLPQPEDGKVPMAVGVDLRGESYGLLIDQIGEVLRLPEAGMEENPVNLDPRMAKLAGGVHRLDGQLMVVLDVDRVLETRNQSADGCLSQRKHRSRRTKMKTCLVVDDSSVVRKIARRILEGLEFEVTEAEDGSKALEICQRKLPDAVLLDWNMPVMDGFEFMGHMRRLPGGDEPKVVFCTTENNVAHIAQALSGGANEYIMKPFDKDIIADKFAEVGLLPVGQAMV